MALLDLIGIKQAARQDPIQVKRVVQDFWDVCKGNAAWSNSSMIEKWVAFADSLLLSSAPDVEFAGFARDACKLLAHIRRNLHECFLVLSTGDQIEPSKTHNILASCFNGDQLEPTYVFIAGMGDAFANLFLAAAEAERLAAKDPQLRCTARLYIPRDVDYEKSSPLGTFAVQQLDATKTTYNIRKDPSE